MRQGTAGNKVGVKFADAGQRLEVNATADLGPSVAAEQGERRPQFEEREIIQQDNIGARGQDGFDLGHRIHFHFNQ